MTDGWYKPAIDNWAPRDAGTHLGPVTIGVLHTTESTRFVPASTNYFGHSSYPHFTVAVVGGVFKCWQHISIRKAAKALKNLSGGVQTNRDGVIQIEVVGSATRPFTNDPVMVDGLAALMRWIESETDIPPSSSVRWTAYPASYGQRASQRLSASAWRSYAGWLGHQHVPENTHGDPGAIDFPALLPKGGANLTAETTAPTSQESDVDRIINMFKDGVAPGQRTVGGTISTTLRVVQGLYNDVKALRVEVAALRALLEPAAPVPAPEPQEPLPFPES